MGVGYSSTSENTFYNMNGNILKNTECEKDLGVFFDNELNFEHHINKVINKANSILGITKRTFAWMDKTTFCLIFKGLVRPHLEYAAPVWSPHLIKHKEALENVQRRATKLVPGLSHMSYAERLESLKLPTLAYRRTRGDMISAFKIVHGGFDGIREMLPRNMRGLRGNDKKITIETAEKNIRFFNFTMRVRKLWNSLPDNVVNAKDVKKFEYELDKHWKDQDLLYRDFKAEISLKD